MKSNTTTKKAATKSASRKIDVKKGSNEEDIATGLRELFIAELKDIYWAEKAIVKSLPKMIKNASATELKEALQNHLSETEQQVSRVEEVFEAIEEKAQAKKCEAMAGLLKEAEEIIKDTASGVVRDAGIISAAQKVEHYEIASYGTLRAFAKTLALNDAVALLESILEEEKNADSKLTEIAEASINIEAERADGNGRENEGQEDKTSAKNKTAKK